MSGDFDHTPVTVEGKRAVVVGGTSGLGEAIALGFAADGADVIATSRTEEKVADTAAKLRERGSDTVERTCDITDRGSLESLRDAAIDRFGGVDVLVNSGGAISRTELVDLPESEWARVLDVQITGVYRAMQVFVRAMDAGSIVNISSMAARLGIPTLPSYATAKGGVDALTRTTAHELGPEIRVNAIAPGFFITPLNADTYAEGTERRKVIDGRTAVDRVGECEELVGAAIYLASDAAAYTTGEVLVVDGGFATGTF